MMHQNSPIDALICATWLGRVHASVVRRHVFEGHPAHFVCGLFDGALLRHDPSASWVIPHHFLRRSRSAR
jgi:hypothetical protein